jgi:hypothetical protein
MTTPDLSTYRSYRNLPTLAGLATLAEAARPAMSVEECVSRLKRFHYAFVRLHEILTARIYVLDRQSLEILTQFGDGGRQPGQFFAVHSIATDSRGNIFTTETYDGKRLQKFTYKGMARVPRNQGVVWPP